MHRDQGRREGFTAFLSSLSAIPPIQHKYLVHHMVAEVCNWGGCFEGFQEAGDRLGSKGCEVGFDICAPMDAGVSGGTEYLRGGSAFSC